MWTNHHPTSQRLYVRRTISRPTLSFFRICSIKFRQEVRYSVGHALHDVEPGLEFLDLGLRKNFG